jgi:SAM-dependent methyltransferase
MRKYHNYIKKTLLDYYTSVSKSKAISLLDLASGKGGDLHKWLANNKIIKVLGFDIDDDSVKEARKRLGSKDKKVNKSFEFFTKDLSKGSLDIGKFDIITSHFAFHYFFKNIKDLNTVIKTIDNSSFPGTFFTMTVLEAKNVRTMSEKGIDITIPDQTKTKSSTGNSILVHIKNTVLDTPTIEYLVDEKFLIKKMEGISFKLIDKVSFKNFPGHEKYTKVMSETEKKYSFMNTAYTFVKT